MIRSMFQIVTNEKIALNTYKMCLIGDTAWVKRAGQFINIKLDGHYLRRPISVCDVQGDELCIIYKVVGKGTEQMSKMQAGIKLDVLTGLGNGFDTSKSGNEPLLIGGGVGVAPLYLLCKNLITEGKRPTVALGFNNAYEVFFEKDFEKLGAITEVYTADGSMGNRGFVSDVLDNCNYSYVYACGPEMMFKSIKSKLKTSGQFSFEARMGCGFGACMGCSCKTITGSKRICKEGPVMESEEIIWED